MTPVTSSNIAAVGYREEDQTLRVKFTTGATYDYSGVPADAAKDFLEAKSVGSHFHKNIRGKWEGKRLTEEVAQGKPKSAKPNCYECKHRGNAIGSAHSTCNYPGTSTGILDFFKPQNLALMAKLNIQGHPQGVRSGWFMWPVNFDPTWLLSCDGFEAKEKREVI